MSKDFKLMCVRATGCSRELLICGVQLFFVVLLRYYFPFILLVHGTVSILQDVAVLWRFTDVLGVFFCFVVFQSPFCLQIP